MEERKCQAMQYVIRIQRQGDSRYLFNTRILLNDIALAKPFSTTNMARRYFRKSDFCGEEFSVVQVEP